MIEPVLILHHHNKVDFVIKIRVKDYYLIWFLISMTRMQIIGSAALRTARCAKGDISWPSPRLTCHSAWRPREGQHEADDPDEDDAQSEPEWRVGQEKQAQDASGKQHHQVARHLA